jgi:hypothetical protein
MFYPFMPFTDLNKFLAKTHERNVTSDEQTIEFMLIVIVF